jgi:hypothetical protein
MIAGPEGEIPAGAGGRSHLRGSHADREQVIDVLKAAFVQGRLARDEFDLRVGRALTSQTHADLAALTADIPAGLTGTQPPEPARKSVSSVSNEAVTAVGCVSAAWMGIWLPLVIVDGINSLVNLVLVVVLISVVPVSLAGFLLYHAWLDKRAGGPPPRGMPPGAGGALPAPAATRRHGTGGSRLVSRHRILSNPGRGARRYDVDASFMQL